MQSIPVYIYLFIFQPGATQTDRIDPCLHIVTLSILEDTLPLIRWMRCRDRTVAEKEEEAAAAGRSDSSAFTVPV